jgi:hypothetical protein
MAKGEFVRLAISGAAQSSTEPSLPSGPFTPRIGYDFALGDNNSWYTGHFAHTSATVTHGRFRVTATRGYAIVRTPIQLSSVSDGQIAAVVRMEGTGRVGLAARWTYGQDGYYTDYLCWFDQRGDVGLTREQDGYLTTLSELPGRHVRPYEDTLVVLRVRAGQVSCTIGDGPVLTYTDRRPLPAGRWGVWVSDNSGSPYVQGEYARILLAY